MTLILVVLRYAFLALLYVFLLQVVRAVTRDLAQAEMSPARVGAAVPSRPCLVVLGPGRRREVFYLGDCVSIGRDPANDIVLPEASVSARHAVIVRRGRDFWLQDVGSTNGTYVNGRQVAGAVRLRPRDRVTLGETTLQFMG